MDRITYDDGNSDGTPWAKRLGVTMTDLQKGRALLLTAVRVIEELTIENDALWHLLREAWPHYYEQKDYLVLEQAVERTKGDPSVTEHLRRSFRELRAQIESGIEMAEALELLKQFPPKGKPN